MGRKCTICWHEARPEIEALIRGKVHYTDVAGRFGVSRNAIGRHAKNHMDKAISYVESSEIEAPGATGGVDKRSGILSELTGTPQERMNKLIEIAAALLARAVKQSSVDTQIRGLGELRKVVELMEKVAGRMPPDTKVEILQVIVPDAND